MSHTFTHISAGHFRFHLIPHVFCAAGKPRKKTSPSWVPPAKFQSTDAATAILKKLQQMAPRVGVLVLGPRVEGKSPNWQKKTAYVYIYTRYIYIPFQGGFNNMSLIYSLPPITRIIPLIYGIFRKNSLYMWEIILVR